MSRIVPVLAAAVAVATLNGCGGGGGDDGTTTSTSTSTTTSTTKWRPGPGEIETLPDIACHSRSGLATTRLSVTYGIPYYRGQVSCGNLFLEADIGGGIEARLGGLPYVKFADAESGKFYTLIYVDPDADMATSWRRNDPDPAATTAGPHAPVRHWVVGNLPGEALKAGDFDADAGTTVTSFKGPSPPLGSHRYAQFLFEQPNGEVDFDALSDDRRINWDWLAFINKYKLGKPVASNWHVTQHADSRSADGNVVGPTAVANELIELNCTGTLFTVWYDIKYYNGKVDCGALLLEADIGGELSTPPQVIYEPAKSGVFYTLIYFDPDADMAGSWPNVTVPGSHAPVRHWVIGNILGDDLQFGDLSKAETLSEFRGPSPPSGSHRYGVWLFAQPGKLPLQTITSPFTNWDYAAFIADYGLGAAVATNWHVTQQMIPRNVDPGIEV